jgi:hypothetical protein
MSDPTRAATALTAAMAGMVRFWIVLLFHVTAMASVMPAIAAIAIAVAVMRTLAKGRVMSARLAAVMPMQAKTAGKSNQPARKQDRRENASVHHFSVPSTARQPNPCGLAWWFWARAAVRQSDRRLSTSTNLYRLANRQNRENC